MNDPSAAAVDLDDIEVSHFEERDFRPGWCICGNRWPCEIRALIAEVRAARHAQQQAEAELRERLAQLEHEQWALWTTYMLHTLAPFTNPRFFTDHDREQAQLRLTGWNRQIMTPYAELTEKEKDSDREWADKVLELVANAERDASSAGESAT